MAEMLFKLELASEVDRLLGVPLFTLSVQGDTPEEVKANFAQALVVLEWETVQ